MALAFAELSDLLRTTGARWAPRDSPLFNLSTDEKRALLGGAPDPDSPVGGVQIASAPHATFDPEVDWRNRRGGNFVSPIRDQSHCGACCSFATVALVESMALIEHAILTDLSEADLHFCSSHGANCHHWWPDKALEQVQTRGVAPEDYFPYMSAFPNPPVRGADKMYSPRCAAIPNHSAVAARITSFGLANAAVERKNYLSSTGPGITVIDAYEDFFGFGAGVYHHVTGVQIGIHIIEAVGFSESGGYWICKNSWGTGFGDGGFFRIAYGECNIEAYPFWTASGVVLPPPPHGWHAWERLGGNLTSRPNAVSWGLNRIDVVGCGTDSTCQHLWYDGNGWHGWESLGGRFRYDPAICSWGQGRLDAFGVGFDGVMYHKWYDGNGWHGWESLGGAFTSGAAAVSWGPNRIDLFARGLDQALYHLWFDNHGWHGWENMGSSLTSSPTAASWGSGRLDVFARGADSNLRHWWYDGNGWGHEGLAIPIYGDPGAVSWGPNRIDVFYPGSHSQAMHGWFDGHAWAAPEELGSVLSSGVGAASWAPGRLDIVALGGDSGVQHKWFS